MLQHNIRVVEKDEGLVDGQHFIFKCRRCNTPLVDVWIIRPAEPISSQILAECGLCGGRSNPQIINGLFTVQPYEDKHGKSSVVILDIDYESNPTVIKTQKLSK